MEADVQGVSQATAVAVALQNTMTVGSTPAPVSLRLRSSRNLRRQRWTIKLRMKSRVTSMKQRSCKINEQGSDGEEVSHEEQQHQADFESKRPCETTGGAPNFTSGSGERRAESP